MMAALGRGDRQAIGQFGQSWQRDGTNAIGNLGEMGSY